MQLTQAVTPRMLATSRNQIVHDTSAEDSISNETAD